MGDILSLLAEAVPTSQTTASGLLLAAVSVLAAVIVYQDRRAERDRDKASEKLEAKERENAALRNAQVEAACAAGDKLVRAHESHATALAALNSARVAEGTTTRDQLVHVVRQVTTALTATGDTLNALRESTEELAQSNRELAEDVRSSGAQKQPRPAK